MPVTYTIDTKEKTIRTSCDGMVTFAEVVDHFRQLEHDPNRIDGLDVLLDLTGTSSLPETGQILAVADELKKIHEKVQFGACAIVATREALVGVLKTFEIPAQRYFHVVRIFRSSAEAETWLASQKHLRIAVSRGFKARDAGTT